MSDSTKPVFQCDGDGWLTGVTVAFESPLEPGVWHIPRGATEMEPPLPPWIDGAHPRLVGGRWVMQTPRDDRTLLQKLADAVRGMFH